MIANTLVTTNTNIYTSTGKNAIVVIFFCNTSDTNNSLLTVYLVKSGGSASTTNTIINKQTVNLRETFIFNTEKMILENGDSIIATSSSSGDISASISYIQLLT